MIHDSHHWKKPLIRAANWLERLCVEEHTAEQSLARVERELLVGFYSIRKLLETFTLSPSTKNLQIPLQWFPCLKIVDYLNWHRIDELFDLDHPQTEIRDIEFLCNQFIHSYVFIPAQEEDGSLSGAYVSSDRARSEKLYFIECHQIVNIFRTVGRDYPQSLHMQRNKKTLQWEEIP